MTSFLSTSPFNIPIDESSPFKDGQPHIAFSPIPSLEAFSKSAVFELRCRIASCVDLMNVGMAVDVLRYKNPRIRISLEILYLWGRMDRRISAQEPYTLRVLCNFINSFNLHSVSVFCPHSQATSDLLHNYVPWSQVEEDVFFDMGVLSSIRNTSEEYASSPVDENVKAAIRNASNISFVYPDAGAAKRFGKSELLKWYPNVSLVTMLKDRDERTGKILGTRVISGEVKEHCVFIDDLCDGGATFEYGQIPLRVAGAKTVSLVVPHGIFSRGTCINGIDYIYTTNSFEEWTRHAKLGVYSFI